MSVTRRSFLTQCLALAAAPAIVRADSLMRIVPRDVAVIVPNDAIWLRQTMQSSDKGIWFRFYKSIDGETWEQTGIDYQEFAAIKAVERAYCLPTGTNESDIRFQYRP